MNDNARMWVAALRTGKIPQGYGHLERKDRLCVLGVGCKLASQVGITKRSIDPNDPKIVQYGTTSLNDDVLPKEVQTWLGLASGYGRFKDAQGFETSLIRLNDMGLTFTELAAIIESEPPGLFKQPPKKV